MLTQKCILALECAVTSFVAVNAATHSQAALTAAVDTQVAAIVRDITSANARTPNDPMKMVTIGDEASMLQVTVRLKYTVKTAPKNRFGFVFRSTCPSHEETPWDSAGTGKSDNIAKAIAEITEMQNFYKLG